jgi:hypothetical protein
MPKEACRATSSMANCARESAHVGSWCNASQHGNVQPYFSSQVYNTQPIEHGSTGFVTSSQGGIGSGTNPTGWPSRNSQRARHSSHQPQCAATAIAHTA